MSNHARYLGVIFILFVITTACSRESGQPGNVTKGPDPNRGRRFYAAYCTACHNSDPAKPGSIGPAIKGSSEDLLEARVIRGTYPPGYKPKRDTKFMPTQPHLKSAIPDLAAYLR